MGEWDLSLGTLFVGIIFNTFLFGLVCYQFLTYHRRKFNDPLPLRLMVFFLFALDTVHSIAVIWMGYQYCVTGYGKPETLEVALWPYTLTPIATGWASMVTQIFLGWRIYRFTENKYLYGFIIALAIPSCALGMTCGIKAWIIKVSAKLAVLTNLVTAWLVMQVFVDIFVTCTLGYILARSKTGFSRTDNVLNRLIRGAIQTGLFAGIFSIGDLITFTRWPQTNFYGMFAIPIGRIYTNTLLDTLVSRTDIRAQLHGTVDFGSPVSVFHPFSPGARSHTADT
ncbi:hypothetical protein PHLGIDRAFT_170506 [Phlebiopsis gigantea 11061_1 CR5-6]|uniref:DUF6534 domain-containing protein n=1 Tax=Phlebiopsis gigantea (strain 11061_1 CR5-6) TaxID=745531 RepID=A0A0C3PGR4_PHLG1|nr:hypothetical protein PHLGIDRAFT_170506 [Phlebiopsis gigantea 11061_1 CR5-6]